MDVSAGRDITLVRIDVGGGSCGGGDITAQGLGHADRRRGIIADGSTGEEAARGIIDLEGRDVVTNDVVRANGGSHERGRPDHAARAAT